MINILLCSINRWRGIKRILKGGKIRQPESFFTDTGKNTASQDLILTPDRVSKKLEDNLRKKGYRVRSDISGSRVYLAADKNRFAKLGTLISHLSLILLVLACLVGSLLGFQNTHFVVAEGETREVGYNTRITLKLVSFNDEYYADGTPEDYRSDVILYQDGKEAAQSTIRVNHPLQYDGVRFYQSSFGPAVNIQIKQNDNLIYAGNIALDYFLQKQGYYEGNLNMEPQGLSFHIFKSADSSNNSMVPGGDLAIQLFKNNRPAGMTLLQKGIPLRIDDLEIDYLFDSKYSGFQVNHDPGNVLVWIACSLFIIGLVMVLYFRYRQVWFFIQALPGTGSRLYIRLSPVNASGNPHITAEINSLVNDLMHENQLDNR